MATNYEKLQAELKTLKSQTSSLNWVINVLKGEPVGDEKVIVAVKQSLGSVYEGCLLDSGSEVSKELVTVLQKHQQKALGRVSEIENVLKSIDTLLEGK